MNSRIKPVLISRQMLIIAVLMTMAVNFLACSVDNISDANQSLSAQDVTVIGAIMGETISGESSGVVSGINDAVATISRTGINPGIINQGALTAVPGTESNFNYSFSEQSGIHTITFNRKIDVPAFLKNISDTSKYLYTDENENIIEDVEANRAQVQNLSFRAVRSGSVAALQRNSLFTRIDTLEISGLSPNSPTLRIDGKHTGSGTFQTVTAVGTEIERNYEVEVNILNLQIQKQLVQQNDNLTEGISGTLTWEIIVENPNPDIANSTALRGNIEMFGDGTALMRFNQLQDILELDVDRGNVRDGKTEFEGRVLNIMLNRQVVRLVNRRSIELNSQTRIRQNGDFTTLAAALQAVRRNSRVRAEGDGRLVNGNFIASDIKFEAEDDDDDNGDDNGNGDGDGDDDQGQDQVGERRVEFESPIRNVNLVRNVIMLQNNLTIEVTPNTVIENDEDEVNTLLEVVNAIDNGIQVVADGEGIALGRGPVDIEAVEIEFEIDEDEQDGRGNTGDDDGSDNDG